MNAPCVRSKALAARKSKDLLIRKRVSFIILNVLNACIKMHERGRTLFFHAHKKLILIVWTYAAGYMQNVPVHCTL